MKKSYKKEKKDQKKDQKDQKPKGGTKFERKTAGIVETHQLENVWEFKYKPKIQHTKKQPSKHEWLSTFKHIGKIGSVEMFWSVINNVKKWSTLHYGSIYSFFKEGITPCWEDEKNKDGCSYAFFFVKDRMTEQNLDDTFETALLYLVGDGATFICKDGKPSDYVRYINGVTFERKYKGDKMIVWCSHHSDEMKRHVKDGMLPLKVSKEATFQRTELTNRRWKVSIKVIDHQAEIQKIK